MLLPLLLATALQVTQIPLVSTVRDDDGLALLDSCFSPDGSDLYLRHRSGSLVRMNTATKAALETLPVLSTVSSTAITPDGAKMIIAGRYSAQVRTLPDLSLVAETGTDVAGAEAIYFNNAGTRAVIARGYGLSPVSVLNTNTGALVSGFDAPTSAAALGSIEVQSGLAADDTTFITIGRTAIFSFDIETGVETGRVYRVGMPRRMMQLAIPSDRTRAFVVLDDQSVSPREVVIEEYALPSLQLTRTMHTGITGNLTGLGKRFSIDDAGTLSVIYFNAGVFTVDLQTGVGSPLAIGDLNDALLSRDGSVALVSRSDRIELVDPRTGTVFGSQVPLSSSSQSIERHPSAPMFVYSRGSNDRLEFAELTPSGAAVFSDVNTGFGEEDDGFIEPTFIGDGSRAIVLEHDSDELALIDVDAERVTGRLAMEREPYALAELASGDVAVLHRKGASLVIVDPASLTIRGRMDLPGRADTVEVVPGTDLVWVEVKDVGLRSMVLVDTLALAPLVSVPLPTAANVFSTGITSVFDFARDRAYVLDPAGGSVLAVDLSAATLVASAQFQPNLAARIGLDPTSGRVIVYSSDVEIASFSLTPAGLLRDWTYDCIGSGGPNPWPLDLFADPDGSQWLFRLRSNSLGTCPNDVALDLGSGQVVAFGDLLPTFFQTDGLFPGGEHLYARESGLVSPPSLRFHQAKFNGSQFVQEQTFDATGLGYVTEFTRSIVSGRTLGLGEPTTTSLFGARNETAVLIDPLFDRRTSGCHPAARNSTGLAAELSVEGGGLTGGTLGATVTGLAPGSMPGFLFFGNALIPATPATGSIGSLCVGGEMGRFVDQVQVANGAGEHHFLIELESLPLSIGPFAAPAGSTWTFQDWYRDVDMAGMPVSNFSDATAVLIL